MGGVIPNGEGGPMPMVHVWCNRPIETVSWHRGTLSADPRRTGDGAGWRVYFRRSSKCLVFSGTARLLLLSVLKGECPAGVLLDRLEECPEEGGRPVSLVLATVRYFRSRQGR